MNGLANEEEAALAFLTMHRAKGLPPFDNSKRPFAPSVALRDAGMIEMQTDWNQSLVMFQRITPSGLDHYRQVHKARRSYIALNDSADELIGAIVANVGLRKVQIDGPLFDEDDGRSDSALYP